MPSPPTRVRDLTGQRFGRLVVTEYAGLTSLKQARWECLCVCGASVVVARANLYTGHTRSCGCLSSETTARRNRTHGLSHTREYRLWFGMLRRCEDPRVKSFQTYGGRGIRVCVEWHQFERFLADMGPCPEGHSIERVDNDAGYEPSNCRWVPRAAQASNKRSTVRVTFRGLTLPVSEWSRRTGVPIDTLKMRLRRWPLERALTTPLRRLVRT